MTSAACWTRASSPSASTGRSRSSCVTVSADLVARGISAAELVRVAAPLLDGRGGGRPEMAQVKGSDASGMAAALTAVADALRSGTG